MDLILLTLVVVILPLSIVLIIFHKQKKLQKPPYPPGPMGLPLIGNLHQFDTATPHIYLWKLSKKYGPLMSLKLGSIHVVIVSSPKMAKQVFKTNDLSFCSRPQALGPYKISYNGSDMTFAPYSEAWREVRKICVLHLLSHKQVHSFRPIREDEVCRMIRSLRANEGQVVNLSETMLSLTSTLICRIAFGRTSDDEEEEESKKQRFTELMTELQAMLVHFLFSDYLPLLGWVDKYSGMIGRLDKVCKDFDDFYQGIIDEHLLDRQNRGKQGNILDLLIQLKQDQSCSVDLTWDHVKAIISDIFIAGTDTGAASIVWTMTVLMQNPTAMKKLQTEIRNVIGQKGLVNEDDIQNLPYLRAAIKEALRLHPPAPLLLPRETVAECEIEGYTIPAKTVVYINAWAIARDPEYWENPNEFLPDRFLNTSVDILGQDFEVIPFGSGRRVCPGIAMGLATVELVLANLLYCFDWELPCGMKTQDIDTQVSPGIVMHKKTPLCLVPKHYI